MDVVSHSVVSAGSGTSNGMPGAQTVDLRRQLCDQNVFVFHLPSEWGEEELKREFSRFGQILSAKVVKRPDGSSKGYGFVCFDSHVAASQAVADMNGHFVNGKRLKVSLKKTPEECLHMQVQKLMEISEGNQPFDREKDCTLFVFHLPSHWDDKQLFQQFQSFGTLLSAKIAKKEDNSSRGYGFVTYDNPRSAALAITNMNGVEAGSNKRLKVQLKQQSTPPHPLPGCTIFVFHLPNDWTDSHLRQHFSHYGKILSATVQRDANGNSRGYGFVSFDRQQSTMNAIAGMNGFSVGHKRLKVSLKKGEEFLHYSGMYPQFQSRGPGSNGSPNFFAPGQYPSTPMAYGGPNTPSFGGPHIPPYPANTSHATYNGFSAPASYANYAPWSPHQPPAAGSGQTGSFGAGGSPWYGWYPPSSNPLGSEGAGRDRVRGTTAQHHHI